MRNRTILPVVGIALLALPVASASAKTISVTAIQTASHQKGSHMTFTERLVSGGKTVGHDAVSCSLNAKTHKYGCVGTATFKGGTLKVRGDVGNSKTNRLKVTGGTGTYKGSTGTLTVVDQGKNKSMLTFALH